MFNPSYPLLTSAFDPRLVLMRSYAHNPQWPCDRCDRLPSKVCLQRHFVPSPLPSMPKSRVFCRLACCSSCLPSSLRNHSVCTLQSSLASSSTLSLMFVAFFYMHVFSNVPNFHGLSTSRSPVESAWLALSTPIFRRSLRSQWWFRRWYRGSGTSPAWVKRERKCGGWFCCRSKSGWFCFVQKSEI